LQARLDWLERQLFGSKTERFVPDANTAQLTLELPGTASTGTPAITTQHISYDRNKKKTQQEGHGRGSMPTHLPIQDVVIEPTEDVTDCERIGEEVTWQYEVQRGSVYIKRYIRPKYVRKDDAGIAVGTLPSQPIDKGNAGPGLMAQVTVDKYVYHMPLDRQRHKFETEYGVSFAESTMCDMIKQTVFWLEPVYKAMIETHLLRCTYLQADETPMPVLVKDRRGKTHKGFYWVYYDPLEKVVIFEYRQSRSGKGVSDFLKEFKGVLQVDGYDGYNAIMSQSGIIHAACMAHVRRKFDEALKDDHDRASYALNAIRPWFTRETNAREKGFSLEQRYAVRLEHTIGEMKLFEQWLKNQIATIVPQNNFGKAVLYALDQWKHFTAFMTDKSVELSNNLVENAIRPVAIGRKNYLFKGSHDAAQRGAIIYSLTATAKLHGIDPYVYMNDLLVNLPGESAKNIEQYMPHIWKQRKSENENPGGNQPT
jgi:transposase